MTKPTPEQEQQCNYPDCKCPFDMGADNKCLKGLELKKAAIISAVSEEK